jgi:hypothetical protein
MARKIPLRFNDYFVGRGTSESWNIDLKSCQRAPGTFHEELIINAEIIRSLSDLPIYLMYSGGIDSEYILDIFLSLKIPITPVIIKLSNYNAYDVDFATRYCESKSITPIIIDINFDHFVTSGKFLEIATDIECPVYQYPSIFYAAGKLDGIILKGSDEPHFAKINDEWVFDEMERIYTVARWYEKYNIEGTPSFLNWSAETLLSFMNDSDITSLFNDKWPGRMGTNFLKPAIWSRVSQLTHRDKKDGFENIRQSPIFQHPDIQSILSDPMDLSVKRNGYWTIEQSKLRKLLENNLNNI